MSGGQSCGFAPALGTALIHSPPVFSVGLTAPGWPRGELTVNFPISLATVPAGWLLPAGMGGSGCLPGLSTHLFALWSRRSEGAHDAFVSLQETRWQGVRAWGSEDREAQ